MPIFYLKGSDSESNIHDKALIVKLSSFRSHFGSDRYPAYPLGSMVAAPGQRSQLQDLIRRVRSLVEPNRHPKTADALDQLKIAMKSWADQIARFVLCLIFLNFLLAAISRPPQPYFSYIVLGNIFKPAQVKSEFKYTSRKSLALNGRALRNKVHYMRKK